MAKANTNLHTGTHTTVFDERMNDKRFKEYRECWYKYPKEFFVGEFPIHLDIESTYRCNLRCPMCARTYNNWGDPSIEDMSFPLFKKIIDEGKNFGLCSIKLSFRGEPLLNKKLPEMIKYAKENGVIDVYINTNAVLLTESMAYRLIDCGLDRISISFEGTTKEEYEKIRVGAIFDDVVSNVKNIYKLRRELRESYPKVRIQSVLSKGEEDKFKRYSDFWKGHVDEVCYIDMRDERSLTDNTGKKSDWSCPFLWQRLVILCDGTILPCLLHGVKDFSSYSLGNIKNDSIYDSWHCKKMEVLRNYNKEGNGHMLDQCNKCSFRSSEIKKLERKKT